jgi:hypothetical protein
MDAFFQTPKIDLTGKTDVKVSFQHYFRYCCSASTFTYKVQVSNDSTTWTDFDVASNVLVNAASANPLKTSINISAAAGNQSSVWIRFYVTGASHYFWIIDDIAVTEAPTNDISLQRAFVDFGYTDGGYYTQTPLSQANAMEFRAAIVNEGSAAQTNVGLNVDIKKSGTSVFNQTGTTLATLPRLAKDTLVTSGFTPAEKGTFIATMTVQQTETDYTPANNVKTATFAVSDSVFARDNGATPTTTSSSIGPASYTGGAVDQAVLGNLYEFISDETARSMSVFVHAKSEIGSGFRGVVWEIDAQGNFNEMFSTNDYMVDAAAKRNKWVTLKFTNTLSGDYALLQNGSYLVGIEALSDGSIPYKKVYVANDIVTPQPDGVVFIYLKGDANPDWYYVTGTSPYIRLNIQTATSSVKEVATTNGLNVRQNVPNPAKDNCTIVYSLGNESDVTVEVYDINGKLIMSQFEGKRVAGSNTIVLNTSALANGVYSYKVIAGNEKAVRKMVIVK